nr:MAG TPA: hypothetical protein [Caudoviricetes sp.]
MKAERSFCFFFCEKIEIFYKKGIDIFIKL